jgi:hypothetical protein
MPQASLPDYAIEAPRVRARAPVVARLRSAAIGREYDLLLSITIAVAAGILLVLAPAAFDDDTWLALVAGRELWSTGLPHHELLTSISHGVNWVDDQWLSQSLMYALYRIGGLGLLAVVHAGLITSGVAGTVLGARRLGGSARTVMRLLPLGLWLVLFSQEVRTQAYVYPLFVATLYLLAEDSRRPSRRVYWCVPLLVLWANLHGSATLGAGLVSLRGITIAWEQRHTLLKNPRAWTRPLTLTIAAPLCLLATPYGASAITYYHNTLLNPAFHRFVTEWQPVTSVPLFAVPFFALAAVAVWSFGRHAGRTTLWERCALLALTIGAITAVRNVSWFGLAWLMVLPVSVDAAFSSRAKRRQSRPLLNLSLVAIAFAALTVIVGTTLSRPVSTFERAYPRGVLRAVDAATQADRSLRVFADVRIADWLLWNQPRLRGRVAYDARFELLSAQQLRALVSFQAVTGVGWNRITRGYRLLVLNYKEVPASVKAVEAEPGDRVLYRHGGYEVILRSTSGAASTSQISAPSSRSS